MMKKRLALVALSLLFLPGWAAGDLCDLTQTQSSTLLIPYFEVDTDNPTGATTFFSVFNFSDYGVTVRVVLWTDWAVPTLSFDLDLPPSEAQALDVRSLFQGNLPARSACTTAPNVDLTSAVLAQLVAYHTGTPGPLDSLCAGHDHGDQVARGYITVDVMDSRACKGVAFRDNTLTPADPSFELFYGHNSLWGDVYYVDEANNYAQGFKAVHIRSNSDLSGPDVRTFYGRYHGWDGGYERQPLPSVWRVRFLNGGSFDGGTELIVWRDTYSAASSPVSCITTPPWWPLREHVRAYPEGDQSSAEWLGEQSTYFSLATQKVNVQELDPSFNFGKLRIWFNGTGASVARPGWVQSIMNARGRFSVGYAGIASRPRCPDEP